MSKMSPNATKQQDQKIRRLAKKSGFIAKKSRKDGKWYFSDQNNVLRSSDQGLDGPEALTYFADEEMGNDWRVLAKEEFDALKVRQMPTVSDLKEFAVGHFQEGHTVEDVCFISGLPEELVSKWRHEPVDFDRGLALWQITMLETIPGWKEFCNFELPGDESALPQSTVE